MVSRLIESLHKVFRSNDLPEMSFAAASSDPKKFSAQTNLVDVESKEDLDMLSPLVSPTRLLDDDSVMSPTNSAQSSSSRIYTRMDLLRGEKSATDNKQGEKVDENGNAEHEVKQKDSVERAKSVVSLLAQVPVSSGQISTEPFNAQIKTTKSQHSRLQIVSQRSSTRTFYNVEDMVTPQKVKMRPSTTPGDFASCSSQKPPLPSFNLKSKKNRDTEIFEDEVKPASKSTSTETFPSYISSKRKPEPQTYEETIPLVPPQEILYSKSAHNIRLSLYKANVSDTKEESLEELESMIKDILAEEGKDLQEKYSGWITRVFQDKMEKVRYNLTTQFNHNLEDLSKEKNEEIQNIHDFYQQRLTAFAKASDRFQQMTKSLQSEHLRVVEEKEGEIEKLKNDLDNAEIKHAKALDKQRSTLRAEMEVEKAELSAQHDINLKKVLNSISNIKMNQHGGESQLKGRSKSGFNLAVSEQMISDFGKSKNGINDIHGVEIEVLTEKITELQNIINVLQQEKLALIKANEETVQSSNKAAQNAVSALMQQLEQTGSAMQTMKKRHDKEMKNIKMQMLTKETTYNRTFIELKRKYGSKIDQLTEMITSIQAGIN